MSLVHHEPDITVVPCLCCDELVEPAHLYQFRSHDAASCCFWHPYHLWCIRGALPGPRPLTHCADCSAPLDERSVDVLAKWALTAGRRVHRRTINVTPPKGVVHDNPENAVPMPDVPLRLVRVWWPPGVDRSTKQPAEHGVVAPLDVVQRTYEVVHETCGDQWNLHGDPELRAVYADHLEQAGDLARAEFVRRAMRGNFEARGSFPSSWVREVVTAC